jgi:hypothetical protein
MRIYCQLCPDGTEPIEMPGFEGLDLVMPVLCDTHRDDLRFALQYVKGKGHTVPGLAERLAEIASSSPSKGRT